MTPQDELKAKLEALGIPFREVKVYGSQIVVTCRSTSAAERWGRVLSKLATVKKVALRSTDYAKSEEHLPNARKTIDVWRTYATIE